MTKKMKGKKVRMKKPAVRAKKVSAARTKKPKVDVSKTKSSEVKEIPEISASEIPSSNDQNNKAAIIKPVNNYHEKNTKRDPTQIYLKEIGFSPLLTAEEEVYYGRLAKKGDPAARKKNDRKQFTFSSKNSTALL